MRVRELARKRTVLAIKTLTQLCKSADKDSVRVQAAIALLDRGYGKPAQTTDLNVQAVKGGVMIQLPAVEAEPAPEPASDAVE